MDFVSRRVDSYWDLIDFVDDLEFQVVPPHSILFLPFYILVNLVVDHKRLKESLVLV